MEVIGVKYFTENITGVASKGQIIHFRFTENIEHTLPRLILHLLCHLDNFFMSIVYEQVMTTGVDTSCILFPMFVLGLETT